MSKPNSTFSPSIGFHPWVCFLVFLISGLFLSYGDFLPAITLWIGVMGLLLPFVIGFWTHTPGKKSEIPLYQLEFFKKIPFWVWMMVAVLALFFRFYKLTTLSAWPVFDEGLVGFTATEVADKGVDRLLYFFSDNPFFYLWFLGMFFKLFGQSLFVLWFCSAVVSTLWVPAVYLAARCYFSKSFSFFCVLLAAVSFWPCYSGRFSLGGVLVLPLEALAFLWLGKCLQSESPKKGDGFAGLLGFSLGLSFYATYLGWLSTALVISATMAVLFWKRRPLRLAIFGLLLVLPLIPFVILWLKTGGTSYFSSQSILNMSGSWLKGIQSAWNTPKNIFCGSSSSDGIWYKPVWGGLLNPVLGALWGVGILECLKNPFHALYRWLGVSFVIFLLPGMFAEGFEFFRVIPVLAVLIPIMGLGWTCLTREFSARWSAAILLLLMGPSVALDFHQLIDVYPRLWDSPAYWLKEYKSINHYRAYQILQSKSLAEGPGLIFSDFVPGFEDQALNLADDRFNSVNNDHLDWEKAKWAAVIVNVNYQPFLAKRFGSGKTYWLSKDLNRADGGWMLWVVDITSANRPTFGRWREASRGLKEYVYQYFLNQNFRDATDMSADASSKVLNTLNGIYPLFKGDPFLEACYWEKKADLLYKARRFSDGIESLNQALKGYPAAHLYYKLGTVELMQGDGIDGRKAFQKAVRAPINFTQSAQFLDSPAGKPSQP